MVVPAVVMVVVPVEVVVLEDALELLVEPAVVEEEMGVQLGRVMVPLPQPPEEHSTRQFLEQAASPEVVDVCQHAAKLTPRGG